MSSNKELAVSFLEDAEYSLGEAQRAFSEGRHHRAVRRAQECVELSLKAILRLYGIEYPRSHEVSGALVAIRERLPAWFRDRLGEVVDASVSLAMQRAPSFYGDESRRISAYRLYGKEDAERALGHARRTLEWARRLYDEWTGEAPG